MNNAYLFGWRFALFALLCGLFYNYRSCWAHSVLNLSEGESCPIKEGLNFICTKKIDCTKINEQTNSLIGSPCGFASPYGDELICCPSSLSAENSSTEPLLISKFDYLSSLTYYTKDKLRTVDRCTAIVVSVNHLLATSKCEDPVKPKSAAIKSGDNEYYVKQHTTKYGNDLVRFELNTNISESLSVVNWCSPTDLDKNPKLFAVGFAQTQGDDDTPCGIFQRKLKLISFDKCKAIKIDLNVSTIMPHTHICVEPDLEHPPTLQEPNCTQCLTASASVLHVQQDDGNLCVAGIATPTTDVCSENKMEMLYYTIIKKENILN